MSHDISIYLCLSQIIVHIYFNAMIFWNNWKKSDFGYQTSTIKMKNYSNPTQRMGMVYQFKLDKWDFSQGPTILAAFGSHNNQDIDELYLILKDLLRKSPVNVNKLGINAAYNEYDEQNSKCALRIFCTSSLYCVFVVFGYFDYIIHLDSFWNCYSVQVYTQVLPIV